MAEVLARRKRLRLSEAEVLDPAAEDRRKALKLPPDINRRRLARAVLRGDPLTLERHERCFIASLLDPKFFGRQKRGRGASTAAKLKADFIAETYFFVRALEPRSKHKEALLPLVAEFHEVSASHVDKILGALDPARRKVLESFGEAAAAKFESWDPASERVEALLPCPEFCRVMALVVRAQSKRK